MPLTTQTETINKRRRFMTPNMYSTKRRLGLARGGLAWHGRSCDDLKLAFWGESTCLFGLSHLSTLNFEGTMGEKTETDSLLIIYRALKIENCGLRELRELAPISGIRVKAGLFGISIRVNPCSSVVNEIFVPLVPL
jgi:hypothetical protein